MPPWTECFAGLTYLWVFQLMVNRGKNVFGSAHFHSYFHAIVFHVPSTRFTRSRSFST